MEIKNLLINKNVSIKEAMRIIDHSGMGIGFMINENNCFYGTITDGDIRRAILEGMSIEKPVDLIICRNPVVAKEETKDCDILRIRENIAKNLPPGASLKIPVVSQKGEIKDVMLVFSNNEIGLQASEEKSLVDKVLVIGGAGYLGSVLCRELIDAGYKVKALDNLDYGEEGIKELYSNSSFELLRGDIRNISDVIEGIKDINAVIHLAAIVGDPACEVNPKNTLETNYLATKNVVEVCKYFQVNRFIFASTCSVYGKSLIPDQKLEENSFLNPVSLYAETKIKCEKAIIGAMDENFSPTILRMATLYGYSPNMRFDLAVNLMAAKALFEKEITVFGGEQWRPWLHLKDAAAAYIACLKKPLRIVRGQTFNVLSENYKIADVGQLIKSILPQAKLELSPQTVDLRNYNVSFDKICRTLNFTPKNKIADGIMEIKEAVDAGAIKTYKNSKYRVLIS